MAKKQFRFSFECGGKTYTAIYRRPMWDIYSGRRKIESKYVAGYPAGGDTMFPTQVKEKFINDMINKNNY